MAAIVVAISVRLFRFARVPDGHFPAVQHLADGVAVRHVTHPVGQSVQDIASEPADAVIGLRAAAERRRTRVVALDEEPQRRNGRQVLVVQLANEVQILRSDQMQPVIQIDSETRVEIGHFAFDRVHQLVDSLVVDDIATGLAPFLNGRK